MLKKIIILVTLCLGNQAQSAEVSQQPQQDFVETVKKLLPTIRGYQAFTQSVVDYVSTMDTNNPQKHPELSQFIDNTLSLTSLPFRAQALPDLRSKTLNIIEMYLHTSIYLKILETTLSDLVWALETQHVNINHTRIQKGLTDLLIENAIIAQVNANDTQTFVCQAILHKYKNNELTHSNGANISNILSRLSNPMSRHESYLFAAKTMNDLGLDPNEFELAQEQIDYGFLLLEIENKLRSYLNRIPTDFDSLIPDTKIEENNSSTNKAIQALIGQKIKTSYLYNPLMNKLGLVSHPQKHSSAIKERLAKKAQAQNASKLIGSFVPTQEEISVFIASASTLRSVLFLTQDEENLPRKQRELAYAKNKKQHHEELNKDKASAPETTPIDATPPSSIEAQSSTPESVPASASSATTTTAEDNVWVDYHTWASQQPFAQPQISTASPQKIQPLIPTLLGDALNFYNAVFGLKGSKNVTRSDFADFLRQIKGTKVKMTQDGIKAISNDDTSVLCMFAVPNLMHPGTFTIIRCHQPHSGKDPFPLRTLRQFLHPQLEAAGYAPSTK